MLTNNTFYCAIGEVGKSRRRGNEKGLTPCVSFQLPVVRRIVVSSQKEWQSAISGQRLSEAGFSGFIGFSGLGNGQ